MRHRHVWLLSCSLVACAAPPPPPVAPAAAVATPEAEHHHHGELHLPPVGPSVRVTFEGKSSEVVMTSLAPTGPVPLLALFHAAWPQADPAALHFDLTGSDGFHPASRPPCVRLLTGAEIAAARIDVVTHDVSFDETVQLPGCYRVHAVVAMDGTK